MNSPERKTSDELEIIISNIGDVLDANNMNVADALTVMTVMLAESVVYHGVDPRLVLTNLMHQIQEVRAEQNESMVETPSSLVTLN